LVYAVPRMPRVYIPANTQRAVIERAQGRCEYCQSRADYTTEPFAVEHIIPVSRGGTSEIDNLAFSCSGCNGHKPPLPLIELWYRYTTHAGRGGKTIFVGVMTTHRLLA
jgi:5-methylcytosine-specific restriction endonuclease McrA